MFWQDEAVTIEMENLAALSARPPEGGKAPNTQDVGGALRPVASKHSKPIVSCFCSKKILSVNFYFIFPGRKIKTEI